MLVIKKKLDAVITDCGVTETKDGNAQPYVKFDVTDLEGGKHQQTWFANLRTEKSTEFAVKNLVQMGFKGDDFADLSKGTIMFDASVKLTVELEHPEKDGVQDTKKFKIKFINQKGMTKFEGTVPSQKALFTRIKSEVKGGKKAAAPEVKNTDW